MVWIALALLAFTVTVVALNTGMGRWSMDHYRTPAARSDRALRLGSMSGMRAVDGQCRVADWGRD